MVPCDSEMLTLFPRTSLHSMFKASSSHSPHLEVSLLSCVRSLAISGRTVVKGAEVGQDETVSEDRQELHEGSTREKHRRRWKDPAGQAALLCHGGRGLAARSSQLRPREVKVEEMPPQPCYFPGDSTITSQHLKSTSRDEAPTASPAPAPAAGYLSVLCP